MITLITGRCTLTLRRGTLSPSGDIIDKISLVVTGGAPGSAEGAVPNSNLNI